MPTFARLLAIAIPLLLIATGANADVKISSAATQNITCSAGVCAPTAMDAVLNVDDLESFLASGNIEVTTTGSGVQASNIVISTKLSWATPYELTLDAYESITIKNPVSVTGLSGLVLVTNDGGGGGSLSFSPKGHVTLENLSSSLSINGVTYTLVNTLAGLAHHVATDPSGNYAFARRRNANVDGTYKSAPIRNTFTGMFEGLGNQILNLSIADTKRDDVVGLFAEIGLGGAVRDITLLDANVSGGGGDVGVLVGHNQGTIEQSSATGAVTGRRAAFIGGLVGVNEGAINFCDADVAAHGSLNAVVGGLVGSDQNGGSIQRSHAEGKVKGDNAGGLTGQNNSGSTINNSRASGPVSGLGVLKGGAPVGGLAGSNGGTITNSFASGAVTGGNDGIVGGLVGSNSGAIKKSYASGTVDGASAEEIGGLVGNNNGTVSKSYATGVVTENQSSLAWYEVGGLVGNNSASIGDSFATGNVTVSGYAGYDIGGLVGYNSGGASVAGSYAAGNVSGEYGGAHTGGLIGENYGAINLSNARGIVSGFADAGGLVDLNYGTVTNSYASGAVTGQNAGGLVGGNFSTISTSFAVGAVTGQNSSTLGGLVGVNEGSGQAISNSYSTGATNGGTSSSVGGLVGADTSGILASYSTGTVAGGANSVIGGSVGNVVKGAKNSATYWDTTTSGTDTGVGEGSLSGIAGLTTAQLQSGLPSGFNPTIWNESANINDGLPYLISNPPPK
jgi:hypothetical protein